MVDLDVESVNFVGPEMKGNGTNILSNPNMTAMTEAITGEGHTKEIILAVHGTSITNWTTQRTQMTGAGITIAEDITNVTAPPCSPITTGRTQPHQTTTRQI